ncbi:2-hydroxyacid dehydrogenase [Mesobacillus campisalis]|uniref:2-hydroxyacid dehydrogenase n=1 Tax=Mesobacillus campisalis TaxID=1408103 RepID=A0A0M2SRM1_9BACI|nr:C-terminal binding protein [Mesobacillus campisalis]KKK36803.1 2-hydroxyacid dehydrogenase [Mesobacillus campisalis]
MAKIKVVVTDWEFEDLRFEESVLNAFQEIELVGANCRTEDEVIEACRDADGILNQYAPLSKRVIESLRNCKVIARYGVGVNTIDLEAASEKGICVANVPDYCMDEVSDHALALLLSWTRKVVVANQHVKAGHWDFKITRPIHRLRDKTLGLVGFGKIPQSLAEKVKPLGMHVIAADPFFPAEEARRKGVTLVSLGTLAEQSDIISVHAPLTPSTKGMLGKEQFARMKKSPLIINTARGPVIDEAALIEALNNGQVSGAALDVTEVEPIGENHPFLKMENVILTPHVAWYSEEAEAEMRVKVASGVADVLIHKEYPKYLVNHDVKNIARLGNGVGSGRY